MNQAFHEHGKTSKTLISGNWSIAMESFPTISIEKDAHTVSARIGENEYKVRYKVKPSNYEPNPAVSTKIQSNP